MCARAMAFRITHARTHTIDPCVRNPLIIYGCRTLCLDRICSQLIATYTQSHTSTSNNNVMCFKLHEYMCALDAVFVRLVLSESGDVCVCWSCDIKIQQRRFVCVCVLTILRGPSASVCLLYMCVCMLLLLLLEIRGRGHLQTHTRAPYTETHLRNLDPDLWGREDCGVWGSARICTTHSRTLAHNRCSGFEDNC